MSLTLLAANWGPADWYVVASVVLVVLIPLLCWLTDPFMWSSWFEGFKRVPRNPQPPYRRLEQPSTAQSSSAIMDAPTDTEPRH